MRFLAILYLVVIAHCSSLAAQGVPTAVLYETQKLQPIDLVVESGFGVAVTIGALGGFVGASIFNQTSLQGHVYAYEDQGSSWAQSATLSDPATFGLDGFGRSIDIGTDRLFVGAPYAGVAPVWPGAVFVYLHDAGMWVQESMLLPSDGETGDFFAEKLAVDGDRVIVGSRGASIFPAGPSVGAVYVFRRDGTNWIEEQKLVSSLSSIVGQNFGSSVAIEGDLAAVGNWTGSVHLFRRTGFTWALEQVVPPMPLLFGISEVELHDGVLYIGYAADSDQGLDAGAVLQYELDGGAWVETGKILAAEGGPGRGFGQDLDLDGDKLIVGAWNADGVAPQTGVAHLFHREAGFWVEDAVLMGSDSQTGDNAYFVAIHGSTALLGAPFHDAAGDSAGAAYVFQLGAADFRRGDVNDDGALDIADAIAALSALFISGAGSIACPDAADSNDDGTFNIADPIALLSSLFGGGGPLPLPGSACGSDPTADSVVCITYSSCP